VYGLPSVVAEGKLQIVLKEFEPEPLPVNLIHAGQGLLPLKMRSFLDSTVPLIRKSLADEQSKLDVSRVSMTERRAQVFVPP
jgi:hypothetical protein